MNILTALRTAAAQAIIDGIGASPTLELRTGAVEAAIGDADSGTLIASFALPATWAVGLAGAIAIQNAPWSGAAIADGTIGHFRIKKNGTGVVQLQGTVSNTAGAGEMKIDNPAVVNTQQIRINTCSITIGS